MLEDELFQGAALEDDRIFVKGAHFTGKLDSVEQVHGHVLLPLQGSVKKRFLDVAGKHGAASHPSCGPPAQLR